MGEKKRKSAASEGDRPSKKQQVVSTVKVKHIASADAAKPIIGEYTLRYWSFDTDMNKASSPGVVFPSNVKFQPFSKKTATGSSSLLLHTSDHPTINYTASEGDSTIETHLKHYVAVFDPATSSLQVTEAKKLTVRSSLRTSQPARDGDEEQLAPVTNYSTRAALTAAFGTKKSKKAVQSVAENRLLATGNEEEENPVSAAMLANVTDDTEDALAAEAASRANKPLPPANTNTNEISEVYSYRTLVHPAPSSKTLEAMPVQAWIDRIAEKKEVNARSRFAAFRIGYLVKSLLQSPEASDPTLMLAVRVLRYIQLLIDIHNYIRTLNHRRRIPKSEEWPELVLSEDTPMSLVNPIISHFFPGERLPTPQAITLLRTTILALTLHIPPPSYQPGQNMLITDTTDVSLDMAIDTIEVRKLFRELGCKVEPPKEDELKRWKLEKVSKKTKDENGKTVGKKPDFAKLQFPLVFPKMSRGKPQGRR